jgi:hypothetical protein
LDKEARTVTVRAARAFVAAPFVLRPVLAYQAVSKELRSQINKTKNASNAREF